MPDAQGLVSERFEQAREYADDAWNRTQEFLETLSETLVDVTIPDIDVSFDFIPTTTVIDLESKRPEAPTTEELSLGDLVNPLMPVLAEMPSISIPFIPSLNAIAPIISFPDAPVLILPTEPGDIPNVNIIDLPTKPSLNFPTVPTIEQLVIPTIPSIDKIQFEGTMPVDDLTAPEPLFVFNEVSYQSDVLDQLKVKILERLAEGATGLSSEVEQVIWDRAIHRTELEEQKAYIEVENYFASRGAVLPPGALSGRLQEIIIEIQRNRINLNNDIMTEQAKLAQTNEQNILNASLQLENMLTGFTNQITQRSFEVAKYTVEGALKIYEIKVLKYNALLETYKTAAQVYESRVRASIAELEAYRIQLEGIKVNAEVQGLYVEIYKSQLAGVELLLNAYKTEMEGANIAAQLERAKLENYKVKIDVYTATIAGKTAEFNLYQARITGEAAKTQVFSEQVKAYSEQINAIKSVSDIQLLSLQKVQIENKNKLDVYLADIERYKTDLIGETTRLDTIAKVYGYKISAYEADAKVVGIELETQLREYDLKTTQTKAQIELALKEVEIALDNARQYHAMQIEGAKAGANVSAQVTASALSSVNANASLGYSDSDSSSQSTSTSESYSESEDFSSSHVHTYDETA